MKRKITGITMALTLILVATAQAALAAPEAYIDPNTGGLLFQALAVVFTFLSGVVFFFSSRIKLAFNRLKRRLRGQSDDEEAPNSAIE